MNVLSIFQMKTHITIEKYSSKGRDRKRLGVEPILVHRYSGIMVKLRGGVFHLKAVEFNCNRGGNTRSIRWDRCEIFDRHYERRMEIRNYAR